MTVGKTKVRSDSVADSKIMDDATKSMLYQGASISQLNILFGMDNRTVAAKLFGLEPVGKRAGAAIYSVREAAALLIAPSLDLADVEVLATYVRKMDHTKLPTLLSKEFWAAMRAKQIYEENAADLWRTDRVVEVYGDLVKSVRMPLILAKDAISNEMELDDRAQKIFDRIIDQTLEDLHDAVVKQFGTRAATAAVDHDDF